MTGIQHYILFYFWSGFVSNFTELKLLPAGIEYTYTMCCCEVGLFPVCAQNICSIQQLDEATRGYIGLILSIRVHGFQLWMFVLLHVIGRRSIVWVNGCTEHKCCQWCSREGACKFSVLKKWLSLQKDGYACLWEVVVMWSRVLHEVVPLTSLGS